MSVYCKYDNEENILHIKTDKTLSKEALSEYRTMLKTLQLKPGVKCLADFTEACYYTRIEDMLLIVGAAEETGNLLSNSQIALCTNNDLAFRMALIYEAVSNRTKAWVKIFQSPNEAILWFKN